MNHKIIRFILIPLNTGITSNEKADQVDTKAAQVGT